MKKSVSHDQVQQLRNKQRWLVKPLEDAARSLLDSPYFHFISNMKSASDFRHSAMDLYHHSASLPKAIGLMMSVIPSSRSNLIPLLADHANTEGPHHLMLARWMQKHQLVSSLDELVDHNPTWQTLSCVNIAWQIALEQDFDSWFVVINSAIETCSNQLFSHLAPKMNELGCGDLYFDVHVEADKHHSIMGLEHLSPNLSEKKREQLLTRGLQGIALWATMLHSWIGLEYRAVPTKHNEWDGDLVNVD